MSRPSNRPERERQRRRERPQPEPQRDDEGDDEATAAPGKPLTGLQRAKRAVEARWRGDEPLAEDLAVCSTQAGPEDPRCILGQRPDRMHCRGTQKSVNIIVISLAALARWGQIARVCAIQRQDGCNLVEPFGADSGTYWTEVAKCYLLAERELRKLGKLEEADECRHAYRSMCAWVAMAAIPQARTRDRLIEAGEVRELAGKKIDHRLPGVAFAGPRFTSKERKRPTGLSTDNACAIMLAKELGTVDDLGCTQGEIEVLKAVVRGDVDKARIAAGWMYGTAPGWRYRFRCVETPAGLAKEVVYFVDERVNPEKPSKAAGQMLPDGTLVLMSPVPQGTKNEAWGAGEFHTEIVDGVICSRCGKGEAELPELPGPVVYQVDIDGSRVEFKAA